jgi:EmrB/QacA subfamily drug resistance transporter
MEHLDIKKKITIMIAIMAAMLFASLNQTIVGTSLPRIIADLGGMELFNWVFTIFMLASSVTAILVGKLSDVYGRKPFILLGIGVFIVGSFLCGTANDIIQLIIYRGIQGLGAGMIMSTSFTAVGDLFSPRERGRWQGLMSAVFGLSSVFGPTLGGYIVDHFHWHWVFWVFLPVGVVAFYLIWRMFPSVEKGASEPVDYLGSTFLTLTIIPLLLAFTWAGTDYAWTSPVIIGLFMASILALVIFIWIELKAKSPVLPLTLFKNDIFTLSNIIGFLLGAGMFGAIMYVPFFVQGVLGTSATASGFIMMPMTLAMVAASTIGGQLITKTGKYKLLAIIGLLVMASGLFSLSLMDVNTTNMTVVLFIIITGMGLGLSFPTFTITVQNAVEHRLLGVATASTQLFRQVGGTIGVAIMGSIMNTRMRDKMEEAAGQGGEVPVLSPEVAEGFEKLKDPQVLMDPNQLATIKSELPEQDIAFFEKAVQALREGLGYSLEGVFFIGMAIILGGFLLTFFLREIPLRTSNEEEKSKKAM